MGFFWAGQGFLGSEVDVGVSTMTPPKYKEKVGWNQRRICGFQGCLIENPFYGWLAHANYIIAAEMCKCGLRQKSWEMDVEMDGCWPPCNVILWYFHWYAVLCYLSPLLLQLELTVWKWIHEALPLHEQLGTSACASTTAFDSSGFLIPCAFFPLLFHLPRPFTFSPFPRRKSFSILQSRFLGCNQVHRMLSSWIPRKHDHISGTGAAGVLSP